MIGYSQDRKPLGKRSALNAHAAFDEAGAGNTVRGAPALDPTCENLRVKLLWVNRLWPIGSAAWKEQSKRKTWSIKNKGHELL
jgi:hypothetical protein